jgi:hypothetical protein
VIPFENRNFGLNSRKQSPQSLIYFRGSLSIQHFTVSKAYKSINIMASTDKTDFASDPRMTLNEQTGKWSYVGEDDVSYEYDENVGAWFPMVGNETNE